MHPDEAMGASVVCPCLPLWPRPSQAPQSSRTGVQGAEPAVMLHHIVLCHL